jgi:hypothetical protein
MEVIFELLFEFLAEYLLAFLWELLASTFGSMLNSRTTASNINATENLPARPFKLGWFGRLVGGAALGALSVWLFPASFAKTLDVRLAVLIGVPIACGMSMGLIGSFKRKHGRETAALESFRNGFLFALPFVAIRFFFTH